MEVLSVAQGELVEAKPQLMEVRVKGVPEPGDRRSAVAPEAEVTLATQTVHLDA